MPKLKKLSPQKMQHKLLWMKQLQVRIKKLLMLHMLN
jgi:hypothetical protein